MHSFSQAAPARVSSVPGADGAPWQYSDGWPRLAQIRAWTPHPAGPKARHRRGGPQRAGTTGGLEWPSKAVLYSRYRPTRRERPSCLSLLQLTFVVEAALGLLAGSRESPLAICPAGRKALGIGCGRDSYSLLRRGIVSSDLLSIHTPS